MESDEFLPFVFEEHEIIDLGCFNDTYRYEFHAVSDEIVKKLSAMESHFIKRGWCIVKLPESLCGEKMDDVLRLSKNYFKLPQEEKDKSADKNNFGYSRTNHKEGIRLLTGSYRERETFSEEFRRALGHLELSCDTLAMEIIRHTSESLFGYKSPGDLCVHADLPVAYHMQACMIDIAHYFNKKEDTQVPPAMGESTEEVNCVPHVDPGLFSISFLSNAEGLQLLDPETNTWYSGPNSWKESQRGLGVLWLGEAARIASNGRFRGGIHRVIYPKSRKSRITMWFETPTVAQINGPEDKPLPRGLFKLPTVKGRGAYISVKEGDTTWSVLYRLERIRGLPTSKAMLLDDEFKASYEPEVYSLQAILKRAEDDELGVAPGPGEEARNTTKIIKTSELQQTKQKKCIVQ